MAGWVSVLIAALELAAEIATRVGDVVTAKRVEDILGDRFPEFYDRAKKAGEKARESLAAAAPTDDRSHPNHE